jgi:hypothetical protein
MLIEWIYLDLPPKSFQALEELALLQGTTLQDAMASAIDETLLRERVEFAVFRDTILEYNGLIPDGSIRLKPRQETV